MTGDENGLSSLWYKKQLFAKLCNFKSSSTIQLCIETLYNFLASNAVIVSHDKLVACYVSDLIPNL